MIPLTLQDLAVTVAALSVAAALLFRFIRSRRRPGATPRCPSCASGPSCAPVKIQTQPAGRQPAEATPSARP